MVEFLPVAKRLRLDFLVCCLALGLSSMAGDHAVARSLPDGDSSHLRERIQFAVRWSFISLVDTYMETYHLDRGKVPGYYRLTHQAVKNSFWNDRMDSVIHSESLLPDQMDTLMEDGEERWKETVIFDRDLGVAHCSLRDRENGQTVVNSVSIHSRSMDPLSAFYYMRKKLSPAAPLLELTGVTSSKRFKLNGKLAGEETIEVPAGTFRTYRIECSLTYWPQFKEVGADGENSKDNPFTLWVSQDSDRFPVQIRYKLSLGSLWVRAISAQNYEPIS